MVKGMGPVLILVCSFLQFGLVLSNYLRDPLICGNPKCVSFHKFDYVPRVKYKYSYTVDVKSVLDSTSGRQAANMSIYAEFYIQFKTKCEATMKITDTKIGRKNEDMSGNYDDLFHREMTKSPLRFSFEDGRITQVCPEIGEQVWVYNFKKGILSSFQNSMKRFDVDTHLQERDMNGDCQTIYQFQKQNGTTLIISKKKLIKTCTNRYSFYSIIPTSKYIFQQKYHKWTPMTSSVECHQQVDHKILSQVWCEEDHSYQPFSNQSTGVNTLASSRLILLGEQMERTKNFFGSSDSSDLNKEFGRIKVRDSLLFDHTRPKRATHDNIHECKRLLNRLCTFSMDDFNPEFPDVFNQFIHVARDLSTPAMIQLFKDSNYTCATGRKHMKDALPFIRSHASTYLMTEAILNREISESKIQEWLTLIALFPRPDGDTIDSVSNLMDEVNVEGQAMMSVAAMVHSFCENQPKCEEHESVIKIVLRLQSIFIKKDNSSEIQRILALKGIGNAGVMTSTILPMLEECILDKYEKDEIKIECISAHRRMRCEANRDLLIKIYTNSSYNQELRIHSYIQLMRCPTYHTLKSIRIQLEEEKYNQVGSYVWSHLQNLMKSSMPNRMEIQAMLQDEVISNKYDKDFRKFSKFYETSFFLNHFGVGGMVENSIIFSEQSYIPKSISSNVTLQLFGESVNIMEATLRIEGVESYVESWYKKNKNLFHNEYINSAFTMMRTLRETSSYLNDLINQLNYTLNSNTPIKVSLTVKTFGNSIKYYSISGDEDFQSILEKLNPLKIIKDFLSGQEVEIERSTMLMDTSYVTPMSCGLALRTNIVGTAAVHITAMGFVNASSFSSENHLEIDAKLNPSIGFHFEAYMFVDAFVEETGVKFKGSVYTSTAIEGSFNTKGYQHITISFNLPMKKSQIFHADSELTMIEGRKVVHLKGLDTGRVSNKICSWSILDETIGLKMCLNYLLPNASLLLQAPSSLFSGPLELGLTLEKSDPTAHKYAFEYKLENINNKTLVTLKFETPGSETKRGMVAVIDLDTQSQNLTVSYQSTLSKVQAQGFYRNTPSEKLINFGLDINGKKHIDIHVGMEIEKEKYGFTYKPKLLFAINNKRIASLSGSYRWVEKKGVSQCDIDLDFQTNRFSTKIAGHIRTNDVVVETHVTIDYSFYGGKRETVTFLLKIGDRSSKFLTQFLGTFQLESTAYPQINMETILKYRRAQGHLDCRVEMNTDPYATDKRKKLQVLWSLQYMKNYKGVTRLNTSLQVKKQVSDIDFKLGFSHEDSVDSTSSTIVMQYASGKEIKAILDLSLPHGKTLQFESRLRVMIPQTVQPLYVYLLIQEKKNSIGEYDIDFVGTWFSGHNITIRGVYLDRSTLSQTSHSVKLLAHSALFKDIHFTSRFMMSEDEYRIDLQAEHDELKYGIVVRHSSQGFGTYETFGELLYNNSFYTFTNYIDIMKRQTTLELHLDKYRDVRIAVKGFTNKTRLDAALDIKWDANRDPTQKLIIIAITNSLGNLNYDGKFILEYPGRVVTAHGFMQNKEYSYISSLTLEWSPREEITVLVHAMYDLRKKGLAKLFAKVTTPFAKWERTSINYDLKLQSQSLQSQGVINWMDNKKVTLELSYSYWFSERNMDLNFKGILNSSVTEINSMHAIFYHNHTDSFYATELSLQTNPENTISLSSKGEVIYPAEDTTRYQLAVNLDTPFALAKQAHLSSELNIYPDTKIKGSLHFLGNGKKYAMYVEGALKLLNESKLNFHIATPFEKYKLINGKYAFSLINKHFIVELKSSAASVGLEIIYVYTNSSHFDLKLHVHSTLIHDSNLLMVGKINIDTVDLRIGWNKILVGLVGRSHYQSWRDVDYSIQLFTPIEGFSRCSAIAKLEFQNKMDFEASVNFANKKIGLRIQAMEHPEDDFAVPVSNANQTVTNGLQWSEPEYGNVYWRGVMQLDSLLYPTVYAYSQLNEDDDEYYLIAFFNFPFGQLKITDDLLFLNYLNIQNSLLIKSTCDCLQELTSYLSLIGTTENETHIVSQMNISKKAYNTSSEGKLNIIFDHEAIDEFYELEGKYNVKLNLETPFAMLPFCNGEFQLHAERHNYASNLTVEIQNSSVHLDGTLEFAETFIETNAGIQLTTPFFILPMSRITINKDFSDFEKKIEIGLALPNNKGDGFVNYGIGGTWHHASSNYMKYFGHIVTPYASIGTVRGGFQMKNDFEAEQFFLDLFLQFSVSSEIKMTSILKGNKLLLQADSTFEGFRNINMTTTIFKKGNVKSLETVINASKDYQLFCWAAYAPGRPATVEIKMLKSSSNEEIFSISSNIRTTQLGYDIESILFYKGHEVNLDGKYIIWDDIGKQIGALITSSYPGYESLNLTTVFLMKSGNLFVTKISSNITSKLVTTDIEVDFNVSLEEEGGIILCDIKSPFFTGESEIVWINKFLEHMNLVIKAECAFRNESKDVFINIYTWNIDQEFQQMSAGVDLHYNQKNWWFCANSTILYPNWNNMKLLSHLLLPHKLEEMHTFLAQYSYLQDWSYLSHLVRYYSNPLGFSFHTASLIEITSTKGHGALLVQTRDYRFYDHFEGSKIPNGYSLNNLLQSTNMNEDLVMALLYRKPSDTHLILIDVFYPPEEAIVNSFIEFIEINNVKARLNCSTPFPAFPHVQLLVNVITGKTFYQRYGEVIWKNNSALFNYTHASLIDGSNQNTDGSIIVDIPLVSRHMGHLQYTYHSSEEEAHGYSDLYYNREYIMGGNYTRTTYISENIVDQLINITVNNTYMPIGIIYKKKKLNDSARCCPASMDFRRIEIFKLNCSSDLNVTGEYEINKSEEDQQRILRAYIGKRKLVMDAMYKGMSQFISSSTFTLRPDFWIGYELSSLKKNSSGKEIIFNITYPRRHFTLVTDYAINSNDYFIQLVVHPNMIKKAKYFGGEFHWEHSKGSPTRLASFKILHPSFNQNITLLVEYNRNKSAIWDGDMQLVYSRDDKKKLSINSTLFKRVLKSGRNYEIMAFASHPATRLSFSGFSMAQFVNGLLEFHKNITYKRSYTPLQFWSAKFSFDFPQKLIEIKRNSVLDSTYITCHYYRLINDHLVNMSYVKGNLSQICANFSVNFEDYTTHLAVHFTPDTQEKLHMDGRVVDSRNIKLNVWRNYDSMSIRDVAFYLRLNTSRMLTSELFWRPEIPKDLLDLMHGYSNDVWTYVLDTTNFWTNYIKNEVSDSVMDLWLDAKPIVQDFLDDIKNVKSLQDDINYFKNIFNEAYAANEFYMQDIYNFYILLAEEMAFKDKMNNFPKIVSELWEIMGETGETIRQSILWAIETIQRVYKRIVSFTKELMSGETLNKITQYIQQIAGKYDKMIKDIHVSFLHYMESLWNETSNFISMYWTRLINVIEPTFIQITHHLEKVFWEGSMKALEFIFQGPAEIMRSSVFNTNSNLTKDLDKFYKDITKNDFLTNIKKYSALFVEIIKEKYFSAVPFGYELNEIGTELVGEVKELYKLPIVNFTIEATIEIYNQFMWMYNYFSIGEKLQKAIPLLYKIVEDASHTALDNEIINHRGKTLFIFDIDNGLIKLEQKLPIPWHALNETPNFEEIPEYKIITRIQKWFAPSNITFWTYFYQFSPVVNPSLWFPPFDAHATLSGMQHFVTFDQNHFDLRASCSFLLSKDFLKDTFSLILKYNEGRHSLVLLAKQRVITIDPVEKTLSVSRSGFLSFPMEIDNIQITGDEGIIRIISDDGYQLECNFEYDVCTFTLSGWYFGKVAGLLGSMDNEPVNDFFTPLGVQELNKTNFAKSWALDECQNIGATHQKQPNQKNAGSCSAIFQSKTSAFSSCYPIVDPVEYNGMCRKSYVSIKDEICLSAYSYIKDCETQHVPLSMPSFCVRCTYGNESSGFLAEGKFKKLSGGDIPMSSDVVFILEAKECNQYMRERRLVQTFITILTREFNNVGLTNNRYAVITFGGDGIYDEPRKIFFDNKFFTSERYVVNYFEKIPSGRGNSDIFSALRFASKLQFRAGVSKTFILIPCSDCDPSNMTLEYSVLQQAFTEKDIKLHILMNADFDLEKLRVSKMFYGLDSEKAYTKSDFKLLRGDSDLRRQIKLTKSMLGHCTPLALGTNGTIFTGKKLGSESMALVKKFCNVFARRIASTAAPSKCQNCECTSTDDGIPLMECFPCSLPIPNFSDFDFRDNSSISLFDRFDHIGDSDFGF